MFIELLQKEKPLPKERQLFSDNDLKGMIIPLFCEQFLALLVGLADSFMVSFAGAAALSGVTLDNILVTFFLFFFTALASGGAIVISQYIGSRQKQSAEKAASQLLLINMIIALLLMTLLLWKQDAVLRLLFGRTEPEVMKACNTYMRVMCYSFLPLSMYNSGAALLRSIKRTDVTMRISIVSNVINVVGNYIGIFILQAGVEGVAYPTLLARAFSAICILLICFHGKVEIRFRVSLLCLPDKGMIRRILKVAIPSCVEQLSFQFIKVALSSVIALFGTTQIAANGIGQNLWNIASLIVVFMGTVSVTVIGQCMGAGDIEAAEYYFHKLTRWTFFSNLIWELAILALLPLLLPFFPLGEEVSRIVFIIVAMHNLDSIFYTHAATLPSGLRAAGDLKFTMYTAVGSSAIIRLFLSIVLGVWLGWGVYGTTLAMCLDWMVRAFIFDIRYRSEKWKQFKVI